MNSDEIRSSYLGFFESHGHKIMPSASLIPFGDPTVLFTIAGMVPFKPYFTGQSVPPNTRMASSQKCFRTNDIESVGDPTHCTFFEMLGNFSFGDYFKKEAIPWAWEYVTKYLNIPKERLWVSIFQDDNEAFDIWVKTGVPADRIVRLGEKDNFWGPAGNAGPCGPCSEIYYDFGEQYGCGSPECKPGCDCKRYSEIWNLVFTEFNQDELGRRTKLPKPNIDTGMGLERVAAVVQGKQSMYETDLFSPIIARIASLCGKKYGDDPEADNAMRVVAEHGRGLTFLLADGVMPGKDGRGYVLRRILRRAEYFGETLAHEQPFLVAVAEQTIEKMGHAYPELSAGRNHILSVIRSEVEAFRKALPVGRGMLENIIAQVSAPKSHSNVISGYEAFVLHDTYGFPIDLTREIAASRGLSVDMESFQQEMDKQRERAKAAQKFTQGASDTGIPLVDMPSTRFLGYEQLSSESKILAIVVDGEVVGKASEGQEASIVLDATPFYGEMGGQVGDTGEILNDSGRFIVTGTVHINGGNILHQGRLVNGTLTVDDNVKAQVDPDRRMDVARNHTATHLLQNALRQVLGQQVQQRGSLVTPERLRFDFSQLVAPSPDQLKEIQRIVNNLIKQDFEVYAQEMPYKQALSEGAIALFDEKYGDTVRALKIGKPIVSMELCGGTHVRTTGQIGFLQIVGESSIGTGLRRIEAVTGHGAEQYVGKLISERNEMARSLGASQDDLMEKLSSTLTGYENERRLRQSVEKELARKVAESLLSQVETVKDVKLVSAHVPSLPSESLREMSDYLREKLKSGIIVLFTVWEDRPSLLAVVTQDLVDKGYNAGNIARQVSKVIGGGGGGKPTMAQAGGRDKSKIDEAVALVRTLI